MKQNILNSSPLFLRKNSFIDINSIKNENTQEEISQSNIFYKYDNSVSFGQENESPYMQSDEDSNNIFWPESDISEESVPFSDEKNIEKQSPVINHSNLSMDENISIDNNKSLSFIPNSDLNEFDYSCLCMPKLNEEEDKFSGDSFLSNLELTPYQEVINFEIINNDEVKLMEEGKNEKINDSTNNNNISGESKPTEEINEVKDGLNLPKINVAIVEDKKKSKINFFVSKKDSNILIDIENNIKFSGEKKDLKNQDVSKNNFIGKKREKDNKEKPQIQKNQLKNKKINNLNEINKVTVISPKAFKCECGKIFSTEENQRLHYINIHLHEKPYNCSFCGEGFSHRNGKIYHERVYHTFIFPYPCKECSSAFASKSAMIYHMKSKHKIN